MISKHLTYLLAFTIIIPVMVGLINFRKYDRKVRVLVVFFIAGLATELLSALFIKLFHYNLILFYLYVVIEACTLLLFIRLTVQFIDLKNIYWIAISLITLVTCYEVASHPMQYTTIASSIERVCIVAGFMLILYQVSTGLNMDKYVYILVGVLMFYFCANYVYFAIGYYIPINVLVFMDDIHKVINAFTNLASAYLLWKIAYTRSSLFV